MQGVQGGHGEAAHAGAGGRTIREPLICFSHLGWNFVFQRPQHLMSRAARARTVFFWEEPIFEARDAPALVLNKSREGVLIATPHLPTELLDDGSIAVQRHLLDGLVERHRLARPVLWYYTPQALPFSAHLRSSVIVYDCMDELTGFRGADPTLPLNEHALLSRADLVFTGGFSLYEAKRQQHPAVYPLPSGVDVAHFTRARAGRMDPADQCAIPHPRLGYCGVIDERLDYELLGRLADARPGWHVVMVGPLAKVEPVELPRLSNIHYLGAKSYDDLPAYLSGWEAALMPFALNEATRFISPTKTPEYLAAGLPVVSTPVVDVVRHYGRTQAVGIGATLEEFIAGVERALVLRASPGDWLTDVDAVLKTSSWDGIWERMERLMRECAGTTPVGAKVVTGSTRAKRIGLARTYDVLVVGAGFAGSVLAERLAASGSRVLLVDRRNHVAGNAFDHFDDAGVLVHRYGPHVFHTNGEQIVRYLSRFTGWHPYEHRVRARVGDRLLPVPINRTTVNEFFGLELEKHQVASFLATKAIAVAAVRSSEDVVLAAVGRELYDAFFRGYTRKQWGMDPSRLDKSVTARVSTRVNDDDRYFTDSFQAMPRQGFTRMFENMLDHCNITRLLGTDYREVRDEIAFDHLVFTGPVDEYFDYCFGALPYRSLRFEHRTLDEQWHQPVAVINHPSPEVAYTRISEFKHMTGQTHRKTSICYEFPSDRGDPYYPVPCDETAALYARYQALADATPDVTFVGRLATYRYYNMDQVVGQALAAFKRLAARGSVRVQASVRQDRGAAD